jgi:Icc protein
MVQSRYNNQVVAHNGGTVGIVQLTDTHLCRAHGGKLAGMDTDHSLQAVIDLVQKERPAIDLLLGTGDLSNHGSREAYQRLQGYFDQLPGADFWLPGNHDDRAQMESVANEAGGLSKEIRISGWQIVMLDTQIPGEVGGRLGEGELALLEDALRRAGDEGLYSLVCLHHQPVAIGCDWLDEQMVMDAGLLFEVLDRYRGVRGVLWGHVHQQFDGQRNGVALMSSPSTCVQFAPNSAHFRLDDLPPGYRWLELEEDGGISTGVSRVLDVQFDMDLDSSGYL